MADEDEVIKPVEVYEQDLEDLVMTLNTIYHFCLSQDLANQYKNLSNSVQLSPLTKQVRKMINRFDGYLKDAQADDTDTE